MVAEVEVEVEVEVVRVMMNKRSHVATLTKRTCVDGEIIRIQGEKRQYAHARRVVGTRTTLI